MKIIVTGGAGFIGSSVVDAYISLGHDVFVYDNLDGGKKRNVNEKATFILGDITEAAFDDAVRTLRPDVINHHAGLTSLSGSLEEPDRFLKINLLGTLRVAESARKFGVQRIIFGSTSTPLYGDAQGREIDEAEPLLPTTPYGVATAASELLLKSYRLAGVDAVCLRYSNVFGPRQDPLAGGVVSQMVDRILKGHVVEISGEGTQKRDFVYIDDVVNGNVHALDGAEGESLQICSGVETEIRLLFDTIKELLGDYRGEAFTNKEWEEVPAATYLSNKKAWDLLGWSPTVSLKEGISRVLHYPLEEEGSI